MFANGELLGTLSVGATRAASFDLADERLLVTIAGQIGVAVQNARLHHSIRRAKREWERTFDAITDPIAVFDANGLLLRGNTALARQLDKPVTDLRQTPCHDTGFCGGPFPHCAVGEAISKGRTARTEISLPDGQIFSVTTLPIEGVATGPSVVQIAKNVTEEIRSARRLRHMRDELAGANARLTASVDQLKSTQEQLLQAEKLSAIGQLVAGVAHELNNPLTSVIGYAQLLEHELNDAKEFGSKRPAAEVAQDLRRIAEESERAAKIVKNLLAFARRQTAARVQQDIVELITRVLSLRAYELRLNAIELVTEFDSALPPVLADGSQIQQAVLNLILNAEQAMRGRDVRRLVVSFRFDKAASALEISVADTGHGMDAATLARASEAFFTTKGLKGTGLGLSMARGFAEHAGGRLAIRSEIGVGTTVTLWLPAEVEEVAQR
jgi:two-component system NtrC family sensor kinase